jgi:hypothetical protein
LRGSRGLVVNRMVKRLRTGKVGGSQCRGQFGMGCDRHRGRAADDPQPAGHQDRDILDVISGAHEQVSERLGVMDPADRLGEQVRYGRHLDRQSGHRLLAQRVSDQQLADGEA